jgi:hypothetical protein
MTQHKSGTEQTALINVYEYFKLCLIVNSSNEYRPNDFPVENRMGKQIDLDLNMRM